MLGLIRGRQSKPIFPSSRFACFHSRLTARRQTEPLCSHSSHQSRSLTLSHTLFVFSQHSSIQRSGNVTFHMHSCHVSKLSVAPHGCSVLNNVCIAPIRTTGPASAHGR